MATWSYKHIEPSLDPYAPHHADRQLAQAASPRHRLAQLRLNRRRAPSRPTQYLHQARCSLRKSLGIQGYYPYHRQPRHGSRVVVQVWKERKDYHPLRSCPWAFPPVDRWRGSQRKLICCISLILLLETALFFFFWRWHWSVEEWKQRIEREYTTHRKISFRIMDEWKQKKKKNKTPNQKYPSLAHPLEHSFLNDN